MSAWEKFYIVYHKLKHSKLSNDIFIHENWDENTTQQWKKMKSKMIPQFFRIPKS